MPESGGIGTSRTFRAQTAKKVLSLISRELGPDAVIIAHGKTQDSEGSVWVEGAVNSRSTEMTLSEAASGAGGRNRIRSAKTFLFPTLGLAVLIALGAATWRLVGRNRAAPVPPARLSAAVIGFENNTGDESYDFLSKVIPNLLITRLEQSRLFEVATWERTQHLLKQTGQEKPDLSGHDLAFALCRKAKIGALVTGSYTKAGGLFATDVKVLDVRTGKIRMSASSKGAGEESILQSQIDELGREVLRGLGYSVGGAEGDSVRVADITTDSMDAYYHFLRGRESYSNENLKDARVFLEKAVQLDPKFAMAYFYLASSLSISGERRTAIEICKKAMSLSARATEKEQLFIQGMGSLLTRGDADEAVRVFTEMIRQYPSDKDGYYGLGIALITKGQRESGIGHLEKALELDPYETKTLGLIARGYWDLRDYEKALEYYRRQIAVSPGNGLARSHMAMVYLSMGRLDEALAKSNEAFEADPDVLITSTMAYIYALAEDYDEALSLMDRVAQVEKYCFFEKGVLYYLAGNLRQAESDVRRLTDYAREAKTRQSEANALWVAGWIACDRGQFGRARTSFKGWLDIYTQEILPKRENAEAVIKHWRAWASFYNGLVDLRQGDTGAARSRLTEIDSYLPDILPDFRDWITYYRNYLEAEILLAEGNARGAILAAAKPPSSTGRTERRHDWLRNVPFLRDVLARAYRTNGDIDMAVAEYERLISNNRRGGEFCLVHPLHYFRLAELYEKKGMTEEAVRRYEMFLELWKNADAGTAEIVEARSRLARLKGGS